MKTKQHTIFKKSMSQCKKSKSKSEKNLKINKNENKTFQNLLRNIVKAILKGRGEVYSNIGLPQETRNISNKQSNLPFK